jgi:hypothetical protein
MTTTQPTAPVIDATSTWRTVDDRLSTEIDPHLRTALGHLREHMVGEATGDLPRVLATLADEPAYHFWAPAGDWGPKSREAIVEYYTGLFAAGAGRLEFDMEHLVVDRDCIVNEGTLRMIAPAAFWRERSYPGVDDGDGWYLMAARMTIIWPVAADGRLVGEDSYTGSVEPLRRLTDEEMARVPSPTELKERLAGV